MYKVAVYESGREVGTFGWDSVPTEGEIINGFVVLSVTEGVVIDGFVVMSATAEPSTGEECSVNVKYV